MSPLGGFLESGCACSDPLGIYVQEASKIRGIRLLSLFGDEVQLRLTCFAPFPWECSMGYMPFLLLASPFISGRFLASPSFFWFSLGRKRLLSSSPILVPHVSKQLFYGCPLPTFRPLRQCLIESRCVPFLLL